MANDPSYVRLSDRHALGMIADILGGSRWSISGSDVKPFPPKNNPKAQTYVRDMLRKGVLEEASKAEFDEVVEATDAVRDEHITNAELADKLAKGGVQEGRIQEVAAERGRKVQEARAKAQNRSLDDVDDEPEPVELTEVHHTEGSGDTIHESVAAEQARQASVPEDEDGNETPKAQQGVRKRGRSRA